MNNIDSYDYYQHIVPRRKDIKLTNYKIETFYLSSKDRDINKYPNKYDFTAELPYTFSDVSMLELVKSYFDFDEDTEDLKDNYTKSFYNFTIQFLIKNHYYTFTMKLGNNSNIDNNNSYNWSTDRILDLFNKLYKLTIDCQIDLKCSKISENSNIHFKKPRLMLKFDNDYNLYYFQCLFDTKFIDNNMSLIQDQYLKTWFYKNELHDMYNTIVKDHKITTYKMLSSFTYDELHTILNNKFSNISIKKLVNKLLDTDKHNIDYNYQIDYNFFGLDTDANNNFLGIIGFNDSHYQKNSLDSSNINVALESSQYICTNIEITGLTLLYRNGEIEIVNEEYENKVNLSKQGLTVIPEFNQGFFKLESSINNIIDYKVNIKTKKVTVDVISVTINKQTDKYLYYQMISCLLSHDSNNGIKISFIHNGNTVGNLIMENFLEAKIETVTCFYDLTYFSNIDQMILGNDFNVETGYRGFKQEDDNLIIYWQILSSNYDIDYKNYKGGNRYCPPPLKPDDFFSKRIIFNFDDIYKIYDSFLNQKRINLIDNVTDPRINYWSHIYVIKNNNDEYKLDIVTNNKIKYQSYFFEKKYKQTLITMNFMFSGYTDNNTVNKKNINSLDLTKLVVLDISELNNKHSNNNALNKCFIEVPLGNSRVIHFESTESNSVVYFNPIKKEINKLTVKFRDLNYDILDNNFGNDYILVFNIKQLNSSGTLYGTSN